MFDDEHQRVREAVSWLMRRIAENHAEIFIDDNITKQFLERVLKGVGDKARISNQCCLAIERFVCAWSEMPESRH